MADTGAPFFLPYPLPSDLVRDGADDIKALAEAMAQALEDIPVTIKKVQAFTTTGTWTVPAGVTYAIAHMLGGGGGGGGASTRGATGGESSVDFASGLVLSNGGYGGSNSGAGTNAGARPTDTEPNTGRGGGPNGISAQGFAGDATWVVAAAEVTPAATIDVVVGAGGAPGTDGITGGSGYVYIEYFEEV